jgi:hypothetical protein
VNALCVLVTTAWLAGAADEPPKATDQKPADQKPAQTAPAPVVATPNAGPGCGCGNGCGYADCGCGCEKESFFTRLKGRFHRSNDCGCDTCGGVQFGHAQYGGCGCTTAPSCGCDCGCESGPSFRDRLRGMFHHRNADCGCDVGCGCGGCNGYGATTTTVAPGNTPKIEPIPGPKISEPGKKLPSDGTDAGKDNKQVRVAPAAPPVLEVAPAKTESPF